ncbi:MAG: HNH endonuclease family protein [Actinomycetota bacterium]
MDLNGCNTRNDILARDLRQVVFKPGSDCVVAKGTLRDRYTNTTIDFVQGAASSKVDIDHVVALAAAWRTGAKQWTANQRLFYANDSLVLLAVDGPANRQKSDGDAADWLPRNRGYRCRYVARQIAIKTKYDLWVTQPERMTMSDVVSDC